MKIYIKAKAPVCKVDGTREEVSLLREALTFEVPGAKYTKLVRQRRWDGKKRFFNIVTMTFPMGLFEYVRKRLDGKVVLEVYDDREYLLLDSCMPTLNGIELRDYQQESIMKCLKEKNCIIQSATNSGKTIVIAGLVKKLYPQKTLILIHREEILKQIIDMVEKTTGLEVGMITSKNTLIRPITVAMVQTLVNRLGANEEITEFFESCRCVMLDECHHAVNKSTTSLLSSIPALYRYGFSGTVPDDDTYEGILTRQYLGSVVLRVSNDELINIGVSAKPSIYVHEVDSTTRLHGLFNIAKEELQLQGVAYTNRDVLRRVYELSVQKGIIENEERNGKVVDIVQQNEGKSVLAIVDRLEHGKIVEELLKSSGIHCAFISGDSEIRHDALDEFKRGELKVLITTTILDEGVDISRIAVLIMLAGKKSKRQVLQRVGRSLRKKDGVNEVQIHDFMDYGSRYLVNHSKQRLKIYREENFDIEFVT